MSIDQLIQGWPWLTVAVAALLFAFIFVSRNRGRSETADRRLAELAVSTSGLTQVQAEVLGQIKAMA